MNIQQIPLPLLQRMRFEVPDLKFLRQYFDGVPEENEKFLRKMTLPPVTVVRGMETSQPGVLVYLSAKMGKKDASEFLGVSESFLSVIVNRLLDSPISILDKDIEWVTKASGLVPGISEEELYKLVPFARFMKHFLFLSAKEAKALFPNESMGNHSSARGVKGEDLYELVRKEFITKNMNKEEKPQSVYDFEDSEFGRVNVKASKVHFRAGGGRYWKFSTKGDQDFFACVGFCSKFERPLFLTLLHAPPLMDKGSFVLEEKQIEEGEIQLTWVATDESDME